ncbi:L-threonylcarbamoyladenylate synthase [Pontibacter flavimaris]|uniref:L-threonylcarbamoyladenylate synthase n=1 Tax=Pontibacter flavimaris TaxID=1797110 RepID=A0A1Q5PD43_9BACT|nr:L-threonylcarbamoyladenylate synthase [Pontibacter flavimaris]OKL40165.1 translation factor Sua5 [Pontibacter flavimaris]
MSQLVKEIQAAEEEVLLGNIILYPTDTVWGIGCDAENAAAVRKIFKIKEREESKAMILLVADQEMLQRYVKKLPEGFEELVKRQERPTTYVFSEPQNLPTEVLAEDGTVAIRMVQQDEFCHRLIRQVGRPIVSTSANISGESSPKTFADVSDEVKQRVDFVVNWRRDEDMASRPSRIMKIEADGRQQILRE